MKLISKLALAAATLLPATLNAGAAIEGSLDPPSVVAEWSNSSTYPKIIDINFSDEMWPGQTWTGETGMDCPEYADGGYVNTVIEVPANGGTEIKYPVLFHNCIFANKKSYNGYAGATAAFCRQYYMGQNTTGAGTYPNDWTVEGHTKYIEDNIKYGEDGKPVYGEAGFVQMCRDAFKDRDPETGAPISQHGWMEIDHIPYVERIQWAWSSTSWGRGIKCDIKIGDGDWQPLVWMGSDMHKFGYTSFSDQGYFMENVIDAHDVSIRWRIWDGENMKDPVQTDEEGQPVFGKSESPYTQQQTTRVHKIQIFGSEITAEQAQYAKDNPVSDVGELSDIEGGGDTSDDNAPDANAPIELYTVAQDGTGDYTKIQDAINAVSDGSRGIIYIRPGVYEENLYLGTKTNKNKFIMFELSATSVPAGTNETDIVITYKPTAIGKHEGRLFIDCPEMPLLSQSITLSAYAIDEQNPPTVTVSPETLPKFEAKVGERQEQTISITTANLPDYAYMKLKESGSFLLNTTMLMKDATANVKVTFAPKEAGEYENEIEIYGLGLDTLRVKINGKAGESTEPEPEKEGDELPLDASSPMKLVNEHFDNVTKNKPLSIEGWKNLAMVGKRAWWGYELPDEDESAGEKVAKVTPYDSNVAEGKETTCEMMLVTPPLDFKNSESKMFTFRVRGDYLADNQTDLLELCYIDLAEGDMFVAPVEGFAMPNTEDQSGEWQEYHIDLTGQNIADVFFMGFRFKSTRGRTNSATYYIDDVSYGRTDLAVIRPSLTQLAFTATAGKDAVSDEITVTGNNLAEPIKLSLGGPNKSKFKLSTTQLPVTGGSFMVSFNSDEIGVHEAYVKLSSRGAADIYVPISVNNTVAGCIDGISVEQCDIEVYDLNGRKIAKHKMTTAEKVKENLPTGIYVIKQISENSINVSKIKIK